MLSCTSEPSPPCSSAATVGIPTIGRRSPGESLFIPRITGALTVRDLMLPTTDAGVAIQLALVGVMGLLGWLVLRRNRDARLFVFGATLFGLGLIGLRALH